MKIKRDLLNLEKTEVVLGNFIPTFDGFARTEELINNSRARPVYGIGLHCLMLMGCQGNT